ncbi:hypothetical protein [Methylomonas rapida]|uniref:Uncharacterized protein n=1 Tax=Methylomonas rapida TaxID=2963939 RepID=A0ABY7GCR0_9GAMM|nr:hypothetical protein [Methylomonas rapida]WAR43087.1 hypothetical protein NM686_011825 [Methylomonas rapida]
MELKDFQQQRLETLKLYLDIVNDKIAQASVNEANPELLPPVPDFVESALIDKETLACPASF